MSYIGANKIGGMYLGSTEIKKAYLGSDFVYQKSGVTPSLPYDAEVEYLQSSGTQWIDTGYRSNNDDDFQFICEIEGNVGFSGSNGNLQMDFRYSSTIRRTYRVVHSKNYGPVTYLDGGQILVQSYHTYNGYIIALFALGASASGVGNFATIKLFSSKLIINDVVVRDYVPVRVGTTGYLYDKVSGTLFGNDGTGNFAIGNDIT
jgi:hypothetical protein